MAMMDHFHLDILGKIESKKPLEDALLDEALPIVVLDSLRKTDAVVVAPGAYHFMKTPQTGLYMGKKVVVSSFGAADSTIGVAVSFLERPREKDTRYSKGLDMDLTTLEYRARCDMMLFDDGTLGLHYLATRHGNPYRLICRVKPESDLDRKQVEERISALRKQYQRTSGVSFPAFNESYRFLVQLVMLGMDVRKNYNESIGYRHSPQQGKPN